MSAGERMLESVWEREGWAGRLGSLALRPASGIFGAAVALRNFGYRIGVLRSTVAPLAVVSVGNLAVGGTGKTPLTLWIARALAARGLPCGILLRGYGGEAAGVTVVSRGHGAEVGPRQVGDEAVMLAKSFDGPVVTARHILPCPNRDRREHRRIRRQGEVEHQTVLVCLTIDLFRLRSESERADGHLVLSAAVRKENGVLPLGVCPRAPGDV